MYNRMFGLVSFKVDLEGVGGASEVVKNAFGGNFHSFFRAIQVAHDPG